ncbi:MAG: hypothetical protein ACOX6V_02840 [Patescibacteria group bacterium]
MNNFVAGGGDFGLVHGFTSLLTETFLVLAMSQKELGPQEHF